MLNTTHRLSPAEADRIKAALLDAVSQGRGDCPISPLRVAKDLIEAFRIVDEATQPASSSGSSAT